MKFLFCFFISSMLFASLKQQQDNKKIFQQLSALQGTWKMETSKGILYEGWQKLSDTLMQGGSYKIKERDTAFFERVSLKRTASGIFYVPIVEENNLQSVGFKLTSYNNNSFIFENPEHDFPKRIIYEIISPDSLHAYIDDGVNSTKRTDYLYRKIN
jgi:hypothetical protein